MNKAENSLWRYSKALSPNDLGLTGSHQAGVLLPRRSTIHRFLPPLDESTGNPSTDVEWWSPQLGDRVMTRYVYYNSKVMGTGTRNEYRLTRLAALLRGLSARPGDNLTFVFNGPMNPNANCGWSRCESTFPQILIEPGDVNEPSGDQWKIEEIPFDE